MTKVHPSLELITTLGGLLGIKTKPVVARLSLAGLMDGPLTVTIDHRFSAISVTTNVERATAATVCGPWLDALAGDRIDLEIGATATTAHSDEAALPGDAPELVRALGEVASIGWDGETWSYAISRANSDEAALEATVATIDAAAEALDVTGPQRRTGGNLHRSLARGNETRCVFRTRDGQLERSLALVWDEVEWLPIQHMMRGFYPTIDSATKISRLSNAVDIDHATVELVLGPVDPPAMRVRVQLPRALT